MSNNPTLQMIVDYYIETVKDCLKTYNLLFLNNTIQEIFTHQELDDLFCEWLAARKDSSKDVTLGHVPKDSMSSPLTALEYAAKVYAVYKALVEEFTEQAVNANHTLTLNSCSQFSLKVAVNNREFNVIVHKWAKVVEVNYVVKQSMPSGMKTTVTEKKVKSIASVIKFIKANP